MKKCFSVLTPYSQSIIGRDSVFYIFLSVTLFIRFEQQYRLDSITQMSWLGIVKDHGLELITAFWNLTKISVTLNEVEVHSVKMHTQITITI